MSSHHEAETRPPERISIHDPNRAHCGRVHDFLLTGGKDSYEVDRSVAEQIVRECAGFQRAARAARLFLVRAVHHLAAECGIGQFVELGSGYPCPPNLHEVARSTVPTTRTLYLDSDAVIAAHGRVFLADDHNVFVHADVTDTSTVVREVAENMNLVAPVAVCLGFVAEFIADPRAVVQAVSAVLPAGSYVILSHVTSDVDAEEVTRAAEIYREHGIDFWPRPREEIEEILSGCELIEPGLVAAHAWRPDKEIDAGHAAVLGWNPASTGEICLAAVGRIP
ncbi:SAM-dependent methyltransferase [Nocardia veterana]|uniref:SAM-dependent methyltransferase n=1 Tax=Nocardia veterana TaxID=132249 RepID=A0A7X6LZM5_9NOCA|nr:SAM-dependent methyltransferase [Nocardia veterana]NKY87523.1 SAM-dependent methyltransferase [Nocardia veterana]